MKKTDGLKALEACINKIKNAELREFAEWLLNELPDYFWILPTSSTGKYHPNFSLGDGGLVRHTLAAVEWYEAIIRPYNLEVDDCGIFALVFHDCIKYGLPQQAHTRRDHAELSAKYVEAKYAEYKKSHTTQVDQQVKIICGCIESHMGIWGDRAPSTRLEKFVHVADYCSAQKIHERY